MANLDKDHGVIAQLINLPEDDANRRFLIALLASVGVNAVALVAVNVFSQIHPITGGGPQVVVASPTVSVELLPTPAPTPEPRITLKPQRHPRSIARPTIRRTKPIRVARVKPVVDRKIRPQPTPKPEEPTPTATPEPEVNPEPVKTAVKNPATERAAQNPDKNRVSATPTNLANAAGRVSQSTNLVTRTATNASEAVRTNDQNTGIAATTVGRGLPGAASATLAGGGNRGTVAATTERSESGTVASAAGGSASQFRPTDISRTVGVSGTRGGAARVGSSGSGNAGGSTSLGSVGAVSTPGVVGRRAPSIGNTALISDSRPVLTGALSDEGRADSGVAATRGTRGTVPTAIASGGGGVTGAAGGKVGVSGRGSGNGIGTSESNASISGTGSGSGSGTSGGRGPVGAGSRLSDGSSGRGNIGEASEGGGRGTGGAGGGGAAGAAGAGRVGNGSGGPRTVAGSAGGGGGGGAGVRAGGADDAKVEAKGAGNEEKKPINTADKDVVKSGASEGTKRNQDAEPSSSPDPELTSDMKKRQFNANIRVRVTVEADGSHTEELTQGTGDDEIDALVLKTMRRWKWRPAYRDGEKVKQTRPYRFRINVNG